MTDGPMSFLKQVCAGSEKAASRNSDVEHRGRKPRDAHPSLPSDFLQALGQYLMGHILMGPPVKTDAPVKSGMKAPDAPPTTQALSSVGRHRTAATGTEIGEKKESSEVRSHRSDSLRVLEQQEKLAQVSNAPEVIRSEANSGQGNVTESNGVKAALLANPAMEDPTLRLAIMPQSAHINIEAAGAGELSLHLRIKDGVADVRFEGSAVPVVEPRAEELRVVLATEGISLGSFDVSSDSNSRREPAYQAQDAERAVRVRPSHTHTQSHESTQSRSLDDGTESRRSGLVNIKA